MREARRVTFGKAILAKALDLREAALGESFVVAARHHGRDHFFLEQPDRTAAAEGGHGLAQLVHLAVREFRRVHGDTHRLLLEKRHALGLAEDLLQLVFGPMLGRGRRIGLLFEPRAAAQIGVHHVALDGSRTHDRHLDDEIVEAPGLEARQHIHLRSGLYLEHAQAVGAAEHVVDRRVLARHFRERHLEPLVLFEQLEGFADAGEHAERQHVDLQEAQRRDIVLVPLDEGAVLHCRIADGHRLDQGSAHQHEAADMLREMARKAHQLSGEIEHAGEQRIARIEARFAHVLFRQRAAAFSRDWPRAPHHAGKRRDCIFRQTHSFADIAHGRTGAIGDHRCGQPGTVAAVARVDILDHLLAPLVLEIDVDVGRLAPRLRNEALEEQIDLGRVHGRDREAIADSGVRRRTAALAENTPRACKGHDVVHGEEIGRVIELGDELQLALEGGAHLFGHALRKAMRRTLPGEVLEMRLRAFAGWHGFVRILVDEFIEGEAARLHDLERAGERVLVTAKEAHHLASALQVPLGVGGKQEACLMNRRVLAHAGEHVLQRAPVGRVIEHVTRCDERRTAALGNLIQCPDAGPVVAPIGMRDGKVERGGSEPRLHPTKSGFKSSTSPFEGEGCCALSEQAERFQKSSRSFVRAPQLILDAAGGGDTSSCDPFTPIRSIQRLSPCPSRGRCFHAHRIEAYDFSGWPMR